MVFNDRGHAMNDYLERRFGEEKYDNIPAENEHRYTITHIRPGDSGEVVKDIITAPGEAAARMRAAMIFPGSRVLAVTRHPDPLPVRAKNDLPAHSPGARFIRGAFRPALFLDGSDAEAFKD